MRFIVALIALPLCGCASADFTSWKKSQNERCIREGGKPMYDAGSKTILCYKMVCTPAIHLFIERFGEEKQ